MMYLQRFGNAARALRPSWTLALVLFATSLVQHSCLALTNVLILANGDRITGVITGTNEHGIVIDTLLGVLHVPTNRIQEVRSLPLAPDGEAAASVGSTKEAVPGGTAIVPPMADQLKEWASQYARGSISAAEYHEKRARLLRQAGHAGGALASPPSPAPAPSSPPARPAKTTLGAALAGEAQIGTDLGFGTKERQLFTGRVRATHALDFMKNAVDYRFIYGQTDGELSANRMDGSLKTDWSVDQHRYVYNLGGGGYDEIRRINRRYEAGPGIGWHVLQHGRLGVSTEFGINYQAEDREGRDDMERFYYRVAEIATWKLNGKVTVDEKFEFFPQVEELDSYRFRLEANLRYPLLNNLALVLTVLNQYDSDPAPNVDNNDLQIHSSVALRF